MKYLALFLLIVSISAGNNGKGKGGGDSGEGGGGPGHGEGGPLNSCETQSKCLQTEITQIDNDYRVCMWWVSSLHECRKDVADSISHVCYGSEESEKTEGCNSGQEHEICRSVACGEYASFGFKDGSECLPNESDKLTISGYAFSGVEGIICKAGTQGGMCGGGAKKDCVWLIPVPECDTNATTPQTTQNNGATETTQNINCTRIASMERDCIELNQAICESMESPMYCVWDGVVCVAECAYNTDVCEDCGSCVAVDEECLSDDVVEGAQSARMRIDEYEVDEYGVGVEGEEEGNEEWMKGVDNMYVCIGGVVIGVVLLGLIGFGVYKFMSWRKKTYFEIYGDKNPQQIEMNVDGNTINTIDHGTVR